MHLFRKGRTVRLVCLQQSWNLSKKNKSFIFSLSSFATYMFRPSSSSSWSLFFHQSLTTKTSTVCHVFYESQAHFSHFSLQHCNSNEIKMKSRSEGWNKQTSSDDCHIFRRRVVVCMKSRDMSALAARNQKEIQATKSGATCGSERMEGWGVRSSSPVHNGTQATTSIEGRLWTRGLVQSLPNPSIPS